MKRENMKNTLPALLILLAAAGAAAAHVGDVGVAVDGGSLVTGKVVDLGFGDEVAIGERVFGGDLNFAPGVGDEPGFFVKAGTLPGGSTLGFNILAALRKWNPVTGSGNLIAAQTMTLESPSGLDLATTPAVDSFVAGWSFTLPNSGDFDDHPIFYVNDRAEDAIYILQLELFTNAAGVGNSLPLWLVINDGLDEGEHDRAIEWTEENLAPTPGTLALPGAAAVFGRRRRR